MQLDNSVSVTRGRAKIGLYAAAVAAGLGTGRKYTGVFLLAPVLLASCLALPWRPRFKTESARYLRLRVPRTTIPHLEGISVYR